MWFVWNTITFTAQERSSDVWLFLWWNEGKIKGSNSTKELLIAMEESTNDFEKPGDFLTGNPSGSIY